jgi:hypothetical protein
LSEPKVLFSLISKIDDTLLEPVDLTCPFPAHPQQHPTLLASPRFL